MSLTKAEIFDRVMVMLGANSSNVQNIDAEILDILHDISVQGDFLPTDDSSLTTTASSAEVDASDLLIKRVTDVSISGDNWLDMGSKEDYGKDIEYQDTPSTGQPQRWFQWGVKLFLYHYLPNSTFTLQIKYYKYHADSSDTIEYPERFRHMIVLGVLSKLWEGVLDSANQDKNYVNNQYNRYFGQYQNEIAKHRSNITTDTPITKYRDV